MVRLKLVCWLAVWLVAGGFALVGRSAFPSAGRCELVSPVLARSLIGGACQHKCQACGTYPGGCSGIGVTTCSEVGDNCDESSAQGQFGVIDDECITVEEGYDGGCGGWGLRCCLAKGDACECEAAPPEWACVIEDEGHLCHWFYFYEDPC